MAEVSGTAEFGLGKGKVFPADRAGSLLHPARRLVQSPRRTVRATALGSGAAVLELGCGPGFFSPFIKDAIGSGPLVLLDLQLPMLRLARQRTCGGPGIVSVQADGAALPFTERCFDAVFIATVLGELLDPGACLDDVHRVLRPGGTLAVAETRRDSDFIAASPLRELAESHGFEWRARRGPRWQFVATFRSTR